MNDIIHNRCVFVVMLCMMVAESLYLSFVEERSVMCRIIQYQLCVELYYKASLSIIYSRSMFIYTC